MKSTACLFVWSFFKAFRHAFKSLRFIPDVCARGTCGGFATGLLVGLLIGGLALNFGLDFEEETGGGGAGGANATVFLVMGDGTGDSTRGGMRGLPGSLTLAAETLSWILGAREGGPPDLIVLGGLTGTLTGGMGGAASVIGVLGMWIFTDGGLSSTGRIKRSASLRRHHRTSKSTSGALY